MLSKLSGYPVDSGSRSHSSTFSSFYPDAEGAVKMRQSLAPGRPRLLRPASMPTLGTLGEATCSSSGAEQNSDDLGDNF